MNTPLALLLLSLGAAPASEPAPSRAATVEPSAAVDRVVLEVDHGPLLQQQKASAAEKSGFFVRDDATRALRERHRVEVVDDVAAPAILVKLAWKSYEDSVYLIEVSTRRPGEAPKLVEAFEATCINNSALVEAVLAKLPAALEQLAPPQPDAPRRVEPEPAAEPDGPTVGTEPVDGRPERVPLGPKGKAGVGLLAAGAAGVIAGGIVLAQGRRFDEDPTALDWQGKDYRPPGVGVMVAGGVVAVTGAVLLILDRSQAKRAGKPAKPTARLVPMPAGIAVTGRF